MIYAAENISQLEMEIYTSIVSLLENGQTVIQDMQWFVE